MLCCKESGLHRALAAQQMTRLWLLQGMAGNIIHAIASTNATIAGMIVVEAMKVLAGLPQACKVRILCFAFSSDALQVRLEMLLTHVLPCCTAAEKADLKTASQCVSSSK